jgi:monoamine oxidase
MMSFVSRPTVVVIGAGSAGIAAGRALARHNIPFVLLEARQRLGGRAWTENYGGHTFDLGCEWLHSADRNVLAVLAPSLGFTIDKSEPPWRKRHAQVGFGDAEQDAFDAEQDAFYARLDRATAEAKRTGIDAPASNVLDEAGSWSGLIDAISTYYNGAALDQVSMLDFDAYCDTEVNWRVKGGYGRLIAAAGADLPVRFGVRVSRVDAGGRTIRVETDCGVVETDRVIVTVPTNVLAAGAIRFDPALDGHMSAAAGLPLGIADKVYFALDDAEAFAPDTRLIGRPGERDTGTYTLRAGGQPIIEGYFGGAYARRLEQGGLAAFTEAARAEIASALGHDLGAKLTPLRSTAWASDPLSQGSYSHALPGHAGARAILAAPAADGRILFAGEATSPHFFSTAHGAFEEGTRAAEAMVVALGREG